MAIDEKEHNSAWTNDQTYTLKNLFLNTVTPDYRRNLWDHVVRTQYVSAQSARSFINNIYYGGFRSMLVSTNPPPPNIEKIIKEQSLRALPLELKLKLYEAIASDPVRTEGNETYLGELNAQMGLTDDFYAQQTILVRQFFGDANKSWLELKWKQAGHLGSFAEAMNAQIHSDKDLFDPQAQIITRFIIESFSDYTNRPRPDVQFIHDTELSGGAAGFKKATGHYIKLNMNGYFFRGDFLEAINTCLHEQRHLLQHELARQYISGQIQRTDPNYVAARVFAANTQTKAGYLAPNNATGFYIYKNQPAEIDAELYGNTASYLVAQNYATPSQRDELTFPGGLGCEFENKALAKLLNAPNYSDEYIHQTPMIA